VFCASVRCNVFMPSPRAQNFHCGLQLEATNNLWYNLALGPDRGLSSVGGIGGCEGSIMYGGLSMNLTSNIMVTLNTDSAYTPVRVRSSAWCACLCAEVCVTGPLVIDTPTCKAPAYVLCARLRAMPPPLPS
jgi:hypothetical protein